MASTVDRIFRSAGLHPAGVLPWGESVPERGAGVYLVALTKELGSTDAALPTAPIDPARVKTLLRARPELQMDGRRPTAKELADRVVASWLPDEVVVYIGLAGTSLRSRVGQYYRTPLGARRPHAGGWFIKLLGNLDELWVHYAPFDRPSEAENRMLDSFCSHVSEKAKLALHDLDHPFPFANLEWPPGTRKRHGITGAKEPRGQGASPQGMRPRARTVMKAPPAALTGSTSGLITQPVTGPDLAAGRIRIPRGATKKALPQEPTRIQVNLRGEVLDCNYKPRFDPSPERSGVIGISKASLARLVRIGEVLQVRIDPSGMVLLT